MPLFYKKLANLSDIIVQRAYAKIYGCLSNIMGIIRLCTVGAGRELL